MIKSFIELDEFDNLVVSPELYTITPFSELDRKDKDFIKIVAYIYWSGLVGSHYFVNVLEDNTDEMDEASRHIKEDVGLPLTWTPSPVVYRCITKFKEVQQTVSLNALKATEGSIKGLQKYLTSIDLNAVVPVGKNVGMLLHDPKKVSSVTKELAGLTDLFEKQRKQVIAEYSDKMKLRSGGTMGALEDED